MSPLRSPSAIALLALLSIPAQVAAQQTAPQTREWLDDTVFQDAVLNSTNTYRHQHDVPDLQWNQSLADAAREWAESCIWGHSGGPTGENLATGYASPQAAIAGWGDERNDFDFASGGFSMATGHFTQLVWKATTSVGCARVDCGAAPSRLFRRGRHEGHALQRRRVEAEKRVEVERRSAQVETREDEQRAWAWFFVCEYFPPGNVQGGYELNVLEQSNSEPRPGDDHNNDDNDSNDENNDEGEEDGGEEQEPPLGSPSDEFDVFTNHAAAQMGDAGRGAWLLGAVAVAVNLGAAA